MNCLSSYAVATWTPPFPQPLPANAASYASQASVGRVVRRRLLRQLNLAFHGQTSLQRERVDLAAHRRVLWIHQGTPQVGDSLMDLAARVLLKGKVERLDLLTDEHLLGLYRHDEVFSKVAALPSDLPGPYDLVLLHSTSSRALKDKLAHYRRVPFAHIQGFYTGPEFNRTLFGFYRLAQLLGDDRDSDALQRMARPVMWAAPAERAAVEALHLPHDAIVVAVGGVRGWRTYTKWPEVLKGLSDAGVHRPVVLVGSDNGLAARDEILAAGTGLTIIDRVARHSLGETQALIGRCALMLCADGGLLHVAHTTPVPVVALFAADIDPSYRITLANNTRPLYGPRAVDDVPAVAVVAAAVSALGPR